MDWMTNSFIGSWGPLALLAVSFSLLLLGILNVLSANTIIRKRYSSGAGINSSSSAASPRRPSTATKGRSVIAVALVCAFATVIGFTGYGMRSSELHANIVDSYYDVYVVSNPDGAYNYWLEAHDAFGKPLPRMYLHFCTDFEPEFSPGQTLSILNVEHKWGCVSVANTHPGYRIDRSENGKPEIK